MSWIQNALDYILNGFDPGAPKKSARKFLLKPDKPDDRDFHVDELLLKLGAPAVDPTSGSCFDKRILVKDQKSTGSCAGQSAANGLREAYLAQGIDCPDLSALFAYYGGRGQEGPVTGDDGATLRDIIKAFQQVGECPESAWPFDEKKVNTAPSWSAYRAAIARRGTRKYYRIPLGLSTTKSKIKQVLAAKIPIVGGWQVSDEIQDENKTSPQEACKPPYEGGHAMLIEGFNLELVDVLNSWGTGYRLGGRFKATWGFTLAANDLWALDVRTGN